MTLDVHKSIREDRQMHPSIYTDPEIFHEELKRIWRRSWLYVAHESEVSSPGDFKSLTLAQQPILVVCGEDGQVRTLFNTCRHRAVIVCQEEKGNAKHFTCTYHGWVYNTKGSLIGLSGPDCYIRGFAERRGLMPLPRMEAYRGFIFVSLSPEGESLDAHLGKTKFLIDLIVDQSVEGIKVREGLRRHGCHSNWKLLMESGVDGHRGGSTHASFIHRQVTQKQTEKERVNPADSRGFVKDLGNGHMLFQFPASPQNRVINQKREELIQRLGLEKAQYICETERNLFIFPNLFLMDQAATSLCVINPIAPTYTEITTMPFAPKGESLDMLNQRLRHYETFLGLAFDCAAPRSG